MILYPNSPFFVLLGYSFFMSQTFPKSEHLYGVKSITRLHTEGHAFISYPFRIVYILHNDETDNIPVRAMVIVSKKKFKKAVDRNRIKRLMRETYRLNKRELIGFVSDNKLKLHLAFQYISDEKIAFSEMNNRMQKTLDKLAIIISKKNNIPDEND